MLPPPIILVLAWGFLGFLFLVLFLNVFGLPANWIILGLVAAWKFLMPETQQMGIFFWICMVCLALAGEALELGFQVLKARTYGSSSSGAFAGMIGAFIGALFCAPLFWGIGAFIGALAGAWIGCYIMELLKGRSGTDAVRSAFGAMLGRFLGTTCKIGIGAAMIVFAGAYLLPDMPELPVYEESGGQMALLAPLLTTC